MDFPFFWRCLRASRLSVAAILACVTWPLYAATVGTPLSLEAATQIAISQAPQVQARLLREQAAQHDAARAGRLPDPKLTAGINNLTITGPQAFNAMADSMTMRTIGVTQTFPSRAKREAEKAAANANMALTNAAVTQVRLAVKQATAMAWVKLWATQTERKQLQALQAQSALAVRLAKANLKGGIGSATDVLAAKSAVVQLANRMTAVDAQIAVARAALHRWVGQRADGTMAAPPDFSTLPVPPATLQRNLDRQAPLLGWNARESQAQAKLALAKASKHPNWSAGLMYGSRIGRPDMIGIQFGISLPIFPGNRQDQDISARYADRDAVDAAHENARRVQRQTVVANLAQWRGDAQQIQTYRHKLLPLAADRSRMALAAYRAGGPLEPWLDARHAEIDTRVAYAQTLAAWGQAWAQLAYLVPAQDMPATSRLPEQLP